MCHVHSLPCYESPAHLVSSRRPPLLLTACYLPSVSQGLLFQSLSVTPSLVDISPRREHLLYCPMLELWSWNVACIRREPILRSHHQDFQAASNQVRSNSN